MFDIKDFYSQKNGTKVVSFEPREEFETLDRSLLSSKAESVAYCVFALLYQHRATKARDYPGVSVGLLTLLESMQLQQRKNATGNTLLPQQAMPHFCFQR